jgi:dynein heavy chain
MPYPELFDRSERTYAATFARYGDLSYFTPVQRIGTYMEFQARLKRKHLMDLISYIKTANAAKQISEEDETVGGVVNIMDNWLFVGRMPYEIKVVPLAKPKKGDSK